MVVVGHDSHLVGDPAECCVVLGCVRLIGRRRRCLREHGDGELLAARVQRGGEVSGELGEGLPVAGVQFLVVDVDSGILFPLHQRHYGVDLLAHGDRVMQHVRNCLIVPCAASDVGNAGHNSQMCRPQPRDVRGDDPGLAGRVLGHYAPSRSQTVYPW